MIDDLPLRWMVTGLFLLSGAGFALLINRRSWTSVLSHGLHTVMAAAMAAMAWPQGAQLPTTLPMLFFLAAAAWFVMTAVVTARLVAQRVVQAYGALTMFAMAWMYAVMGGQLRTGLPSLGHHMPPEMPMADMNMADMDSHPSDDWPRWIDTGTCVWTVLFVIAAFVWSYWLVIQRGAGRGRRGQVWRGWLNSTAQAVMAAGMAIMFATMLFSG